MSSTELRTARTGKGLTQAQAAVRLGVSQPYVAMLERGERRLTPRLARRVARLYGLSPTAVPPSSSIAESRGAAELASDRYRSGIVSYLEVVDASREALQAERANAQLTGQRLSAAVQLIKALGGGWSATEIFANASSLDAQRFGKNQKREKP